jgi:hypothetical protein
MIQYFPIVTGSLTVLGNISVSGSITTSGSITISGSITSASFATSASNATNAISASYANNLTVAGTLTAQTLVVQTITSSISSVTGSTNFGSLSSNTHTFTGSMSVSGSAAFSGSVDGTIINSTSNAFRFSGNNALSLVTLNSQSVVKINAAGYWGAQLVGAGDAGILVNNTGSIGIGTNSPQLRVDIQNGSLGIYHTTSGSNGAQIYLGDMNFPGGAYATSAPGIGAVYNSASGVSSDLAFYVYTGVQASRTERMRIQSNGNVLIGTTKDVGQKVRIYQPTTSEWNIKLIQLNGSNQLFQEFLTTTDNDATNTARGSITYNGTNVLFNGTSDYRLKEDLKDYNALNIINQLKTYDFKWKEAGIRDYGMMAHELQEVLPNIVTGEKDALNEDNSIKPQGVDYSKLVPVLVKAIQELNTKFEEYKATHP